MRLQKKRPARVTRAPSQNDLLAGIDFEDSQTPRSLQVLRLAERFGLTLSTAAVVADLAGLAHEVRP